MSCIEAGVHVGGDFLFASNSLPIVVSLMYAN